MAVTQMVKQLAGRVPAVVPPDIGESRRTGLRRVEQRRSGQASAMRQAMPLADTLQAQQRQRAQAGQPKSA